jgi:hypothetical protein
MDIREKLQSIVRRNFSLFTGNENLFPAFDIPSDSLYRSITRNIAHRITLVIHADDAPLIRSTKSAVWPCFSSNAGFTAVNKVYHAHFVTMQS